MAETLRRVLTAPELQAELKRKGIAQAARFSYRETARQTLEVYRKVAGR
jgi:glycosyltransferase involved in cell wall biosynthesis